MSATFDRLKAVLSDRYQLDAEIGSGGMATVYHARDIRHDREVAIKVLRPELALAVGSERFLREVKIAAQLQHPHILPLYDSGAADNFLYFVMPYIDGVSLRKKLSDEGELPIPEVVRIVRDVADALAYAHEHGVVHRDIKPDNIMLSGRHSLVADFGIAKAIDKASSTTLLTTAGLALGTPSYMSPEQASGDPTVDHRADIYAIGAMTYEMLTGEPPFKGDTAQQVLSAHVVQAPEPITERRPSLPRSLAQLVMRCLEKKPADRWQSAEELLSQLEMLATPSGGMTPTSTQPVGALKPKSKNLAAKVAAGFAAAAVVAAGAVTMVRGSGLEVEPGLTAVERIAVLPIRDLSNDPANAPFVDATLNLVTAELTLLGRFRVTHETSVMRYKHTDKTVPEIARELNVDAILQVSMLAARGMLRASVYLTDGETDKNIWTFNYQGELADSSVARSTMAAEIAQALAAELEE